MRKLFILVLLILLVSSSAIGVEHQFSVVIPEGKEGIEVTIYVQLIEGEVEVQYVDPDGRPLALVEREIYRKGTHEIQPKTIEGYVPVQDSASVTITEVGQKESVVFRYEPIKVVEPVKPEIVESSPIPVTNDTSDQVEDVNVEDKEVIDPVLLEGVINVTLIDEKGDAIVGALVSIDGFVYVSDKDGQVKHLVSDPGSYEVTLLEDNLEGYDLNLLELTRFAELSIDNPIVDFEYSLTNKVIPKSSTFQNVKSFIIKHIKKIVPTALAGSLWFIPPLWRRRRKDDENGDDI
jgi:hypothetical protein